MINIHKTMWPTIHTQIHTWELNGKKTWIDQMYASWDIFNKGGIIEAGIETSHVSYTSDHHMMGITTNFSNILGRIKQLLIQQQIRRRTVKAGNKESKREYQTIAKKKEKNNK